MITCKTGTFCAQERFWPDALPDATNDAQELQQNQNPLNLVLLADRPARRPLRRG